MLLICASYFTYKFHNIGILFSFVVLLILLCVINIQMNVFNWFVVNRYGDMVNYHDVTIESCFGLMESFSAYQKILAETSDGKQRFDDFRKR